MTHRNTPLTNPIRLTPLREALSSIPIPVYNNCKHINKTPFIKCLEQMSQMVQASSRQFFSGTCYKCASMAYVGVCLKLCSGCLLVSYCSKNCQREDWNHHKIACKRFIVKENKNIIQRKLALFGKDENFKVALLKLQRSVSEDMEGMEHSSGEDQIFKNPRVCHVCNEARPTMLSYCRCCSVSYCSEEHRIIDTHNGSQECDQLYASALANCYLTQNRQLIFPDEILNEANLNEGLKYDKISQLDKYSGLKWLKTIVNLINERLAFPMTIYYALKNLRLGEHGKNISEMTSLTIHIIHNDIMLDPRIWEFFLHHLPNLKYLNLTFINKILSECNSYNTYLPIERCSDCKTKQRVINYSLKHMHYHEYFETNDYVQPDVVVVFGVSRLLVNNIYKDPKNDAHLFTSRRDTTYSDHSVVILTDKHNDLEESLNSFYDARPVKVLLPVQKNPVSGFCKKRFMNDIYDEKYYMCCIQGDT